MIESANVGPGLGTRQVSLIVIGALTGLLGLALLAGGGVLAWAHGTKRDADGFYTTGRNSLATPTYGFVSDGLDVGSDGPNWLFRDGRLGTVRVTATGDAAHPVFVGIARKSAVASYLHSVPHDEVTDFEVDPFAVSYSRRPGRIAPAAPIDQDLWAVEASGVGQQTVSWPVRNGNWVVVVMNRNAAPGVRTEVSVGAKVPLVLWLGISLLGAGAVLAAVGGTAIFLGAR